MNLHIYNNNININISLNCEYSLLINTAVWVGANISVNHSPNPGSLLDYPSISSEVSLLCQLWICYLDKKHWENDQRGDSEWEWAAAANSFLLINNWVWVLVTGCLNRNYAQPTIHIRAWCHHLWDPLYQDQYTSLHRVLEICHHLLWSISQCWESCDESGVNNCIVRLYVVIHYPVNCNIIIQPNNPSVYTMGFPRPAVAEWHVPALVTVSAPAQMMVRKLGS